MHRSIQTIFDRRAMLDRAHDGAYQRPGAARQRAIASMASCWHSARRMIGNARKWRAIGNERMALRCVQSAQAERANAKMYRREAATHPSE